MFRSENPPSPGDIRVDAPPSSDNPTTAMLKADIDSGRTGDKVAHYDPGLSQLGTDDEAAGNAPSPERIALARKTEAAPDRVHRAADPHGSRSWVMPAFVSFIVAIPLIIGSALWLAR